MCSTHGAAPTTTPRASRSSCVIHRGLSTASRLTVATTHHRLPRRSCEAVSAKQVVIAMDALISAHTKSGNYAQDKMKSMYEELGLAPGQMGLQG